MKKLLISFMIMFALLAFCTKKPSQEDLSRLEESKSAAESAERKLSELRTERMDLEAKLESKRGESQKLETERNELKK